MAVQPQTSWFKIPYDGSFYSQGSDEFLAWQGKVLELPVITMLEQFVTEKIGDRGKAKFVMVDDGSYNIIFKFKFVAAPSQQVALRFPKPGHTAAALITEKLENEAYWMQYMEEHGILKVPHVYSWSTQGLDGIGPYILMDFVEGEKLNEHLSKWAKSTEPADKEKLAFVYEQLARMLLQLSRPRFDRIGSVTKTPGWAITRRPLTMDMHQQELGVPGFPTDIWPAGPLSSAGEYKALVADLLEQQLKHLLNLNIPFDLGGRREACHQEGSAINLPRAMEIARLRLLARRGFAMMPDSTSSLGDGNDDDGGPFTIFNPDFRPGNMLIDPATAEIKAVIDLEYTNTMPAMFAQDPPLWLFHIPPATAIEAGFFLWWMDEYEPCLKEFLSAMERVEAEEQQQQHRHHHQEPQRPPLSALMRESWESRRWMVNFATQNIDILDALSVAMPEVFPRPNESPSLRKEVEAYQALTRGHIAAYERKRVAKSERE